MFHIITIRRYDFRHDAVAAADILHFAIRHARVAAVVAAFFTPFR